MKRSLLGIAACTALAAALCGCGGPALDREVTVMDLTMKVPSSYVEEESPYDDEFDSVSGSVTFSSTSEEGGSIIRVEYNDYEYGLSPEEIISDEAELLASIGSPSNKEYEPMGEAVIDGAQCSVYHTSEVYSDDVTFENSEAFLSANGLAYRIIIYGDEVSIEDFVKTISVAD